VLNACAHFIGTIGHILILRIELLDSGHAEFSNRQKESRNQEISSLLRFMKMVYVDSASLNLQNCIRYQEPLPVSWIAISYSAISAEDGILETDWIALASARYALDAVKRWPVAILPIRLDCVKLASILDCDFVFGDFCRGWFSVSSNHGTNPLHRRIKM